MSTLVLTTQTNPGDADWTDSTLLPTSSGFQVVDTLADRDAIPAGVREAGMWVSVAETGVVYYLDGGITNADWALVDLSRPLTDTTGATEAYVDGTSGSDENGTGTALLPFQTITRALQSFGSQNFQPGASPTRIIHIVGTVAYPGTLSGLNSIEFRGAAATTTLTATIASVTSATDGRASF